MKEEKEKKIERIREELEFFLAMKLEEEGITANELLKSINISALLKKQH